MVDGTPSRDGMASPGALRQWPLAYAEVSQGIQRIFKERQEPMPVERLEEEFLQRFGVSIPECVCVSTREYLSRKQNVFEFDAVRGTAFLQHSILAGPPLPDPNLPKDEDLVLDEFERLIIDLGPICYISALCGKFIQRNGISVTSVTIERPLDLLKRHPHRFLLVGGGNISLPQFRDLPEVKSAMSQGCVNGRRVWIEDGRQPPADLVTEEDVVREFQRLIGQNGGEPVYISSLCGRFMQQFRKPVTNIVKSRPADFLRKHPELFELVGGGHVRLRAPGQWESDGPQTIALRQPAGKAALSGGACGGGDGGVGEGAPQGGALAPGPGPAPGGRAPAPGPAGPGPGPVPGPPAGPRAEELGGDDFLAEAVGCIAPPGYSAALMKQLRQLGEIVRQHSFLTIEDIVLGGAVGKGLAVRGPPEAAELALLVGGFPESNHADWLPHILEMVLAVLDMVLGDRARDVRRVGNSWAELVLLGQAEEGSAVGPVADVLVAVVVAPSPGPRALLSQLIRGCPVAERQYLAPGLARERLDLVARQVEVTRDGMRLLRFWAAAQSWSCSKATPPSYLLELLILFVAKQGAVGLAALLEAAMDLCVRIRELRILWDGMDVASFETLDICPDVRAQTPLLVDPTNPCANVLDPGTFDGSELSTRAARFVQRGATVQDQWGPLLDAAVVAGHPRVHGFQRTGKLGVGLQAVR